MRKFITLSICTLLGIAAGYFVAPAVSMAYVQTAEPDMFGAFMLSTIDSSIACKCQNQPPNESLQTVSDDLAALQRWRSQNPQSVQLRQEIGLAEVHLSRLNEELGRQSQAEKEMKQAQAELTVLGWKNVSPSHLVALTKQLDSEYENPNQRSQSVQPKKLASR